MSSSACQRWLSQGSSSTRPPPTGGRAAAGGHRVVQYAARLTRRLIFAGKVMADDKAAKDYAIEGGSVLHLVITLVRE